MDRKGLSSVIVILVIAVIVLVGGGYWYFNRAPQNATGSGTSSTTGQTASGSIPYTRTAPEPPPIMGYIRNVYTSGGHNYFDVDQIQWLSAFAGTCSMGNAATGKVQCLPSGYRIVNDDVSTSTFEVSDNVEIQVQNIITCGWTPMQNVDFETFARFWGDHPSCLTIQRQPYTLTVHDNIIQSVIEAYTP